MIYKISTHFTKSLSTRKNKTISLRSLNLYSNDSEKLNENEDKKFFNQSKTNKNKNIYNINKENNFIKYNLNKTNIKQRYFQILKNNLSLKENSKNMTPNYINIDKNSSEKNQKIINKLKENKFLFRLKIKKNNPQKIPKSNSFINIRDFSTLHSSFNLNVDKNTTLSSKRKLDKKKIIYSYMKKNSQINTPKNIMNRRQKSKNTKKIINVLFEKRKKYPFIYNSSYIKPQKFVDLPESITCLNKKFSTILNQENISLFAQSFNIIDKKKFSKKFQSPLIFLGNSNIIGKNKENEKYKEITHGKGIIKNLDDIIKLNKDKLNKIFKTRKAVIFFKFRQKLREILLISKSLMIPMSEIINTYKISKHIFNFEKTNDLIYAIKTNNFDSAFKILVTYKYLILDVDQFYLTPLHYAAKYNFYKIIPLILGLGAYVDTKNSFCETPLMISVKKNYYESMLLLFLHYASPFMRFTDGKKLKEFCKDFNTNLICDKIKDIYIRNLLVKPKNFYVSVKNEITCFIINECQGHIKSDCFDYIQKKLDFYKFDK